MLQQLEPLEEADVGGHHMATDRRKDLDFNFKVGSFSESLDFIDPFYLSSHSQLVSNTFWCESTIITTGSKHSLLNRFSSRNLLNGKSS